MEIRRPEGELYQPISELLNQYQQRTGIPYLKLDMDVIPCVLSEELDNVTIKASKNVNNFKNQHFSVTEHYVFQLNMILEYRNTQTNFNKTLLR